MIRITQNQLHAGQQITPNPFKDNAAFLFYFFLFHFLPSKLSQKAVFEGITNLNHTKCQHISNGGAECLCG